APEFVLGKSYSNYKNMIENYSRNYRVLVLAHSKNNFKNKELPEDIELIGIIFLLDKIRLEASDTLEYFYKQGVDVKIISGDNPITVSKIAKRVGVKNHYKYVDMSLFEDDTQIDESILEC